MFVDNKGGGAGVPAMQDVAKAAPDGYTIILGHVGSLAVHPVIFPNLPFDVNRDFMPVTLLAKVPNLFVIHPDVPAKDFKAFVAYAKANPGKLNYGSAGNASAGHLAMEYLKLVTGMYITHIPYRGTGPALTDLLAGRTQAFSAGTPALLPHIKAGRLRAIAMGTARRLPVLPDVPTVAEMGYKDFETSQWYGILAPAGTPRDIVKRLQEESLIALKSNTVTERFASDSAIGGGGPPEEFAAFIAQQQRVWKDICRARGHQGRLTVTPRGPAKRSCAARRGSREHDESERDQRRQRLHEQDLAAGRDRTVHAGDQHAQQEEHLHRGACGAEAQAPEQSCGEKAVVEPLVGGQHLARGRGFGRVPERTQPRGLVPQEHLEHQKVQVQQRDQRDQDVGNDRHAGSSMR